MQKRGMGLQANCCGEHAGPIEDAGRLNVASWLLRVVKVLVSGGCDLYIRLEYVEASIVFTPNKPCAHHKARNLGVKMSLFH